MTPGELLLYWITHMREGSWSTFRRTVEAQQSDESASRRYTPVYIRARLSELAHAEFFVGGSNRWRTFAPLLGGLSSRSAAILAGGRTRLLIDNVVNSAERAGCSAEVQEDGDGPNRVEVFGDSGAVSLAAQLAGVPYVSDLASALAATVEPVAAVLARSAPAAAPINWSARSFDLDTLRWVDGLLPSTAYEYRSRHGRLNHYVRGPRRTLLQLDRRNAVYAAARARRVRLLAYDEHVGTLSVPRDAPMPDAMARAAAACSGTPAEARDGRLVYVGVAPAIAGALMAAVGQRPPAPHWLD